MSDEVDCEPCHPHDEATRIEATTDPERGNLHTHLSALLLLLLSLALTACGDDDAAVDAAPDARVDAPLMDVTGDVAPDSSPPVDPELQERAERAAALLRPWFEAGWYDTVVIGMRDGESEAYASLGVLADGAPVGPDTSYEIGSITKPLTGLLLRDAEQREEVTMDTPVADLLPSANIPRGPDGGVVALWHLASHTSGFPTFPEVPDPLAYDRDALFAWFETFELTREPGTAFEYSNLSVGLLGYALGENAGSTYAEHLQDRVLDPLGLTSTTLSSPPVAVPHSATRTPIDTLSLEPISEAAGELRSTARDMLRFARVQLHPEEAPAPLDDAIVASQVVLFADDPIVLATNWFFRDDREVLWHNGVTIGSHAFLGVVPSEDRAVVVLANISNHSESARHQIWALDTLREREVFDRAPPEVFTIPDLSILDDYLGTYDLEETPTIVRRVGDWIEIQVEGQLAYPLFPLAEDAFYTRAIAHTTVRFLRDDEGAVNAMELTQGRVVVAPRVDR